MKNLDKIISIFVGSFAVAYLFAEAFENTNTFLAYLFIIGILYLVIKNLI
jgi:hypothetical protein